MSTTLDGQILFDDDKLAIEPASVTRESLQIAVPGLDGLLSIDLGKRARTIKQKGLLTAQSSQQMNNKISAISAYIDGNTHKLITDTGQEFDNLRMDTFKVSQQRTSGAAVLVDYEIVYTQLV